jgi:hypothetical protein
LLSSIPYTRQDHVFITTPNDFWLFYKIKSTLKRLHTREEARTGGAACMTSVYSRRLNYLKVDDTHWGLQIIVWLLGDWSPYFKVLAYNIKLLVVSFTH